MQASNYFPKLFTKEVCKRQRDRVIATSIFVSFLNQGENQEAQLTAYTKGRKQCLQYKCSISPLWNLTGYQYCVIWKNIIQQTFQHISCKLLETHGFGAALLVLMQHKMQVENKNAINLSNNTIFKYLNIYVKHSNTESLLARMSFPQPGESKRYARCQNIICICNIQIIIITE